MASAITAGFTGGGRMTGAINMDSYAITFGTGSSTYPNAQIIQDAAGGILIKAYTAAPTAPTATIAAGAGVDAGTHSYKVTFITAGGETDAGTVSNVVTTAGGNLQVNLTAIPLGNQFVTGRNVYRCAIGNEAVGPWKLIAASPVIPNNTATTLSDNTADVALTTTIPTTNTALDTRATVNNAGQVLTAKGTAFTPSITSSADPTSGLHFPGATVGFIAAGTPVWRMDTVRLYPATDNGAGSDIGLVSKRVRTLYALSLGVGVGTTTVGLGGTYAKFVSAAGVGNGADVTNDPLWTLTPIPANTFTANGDALVLTLEAATGATGNNKTFGVTVGGTQMTSTVSAGNNVPGIITVLITRVDATHVNVVLTWLPAGQFAASHNLAVSDLTTNTLAVIVTGASPTTGAANDVLLFSGVAEFKKWPA